MKLLIVIAQAMIFTGIICFSIVARDAKKTGYNWTVWETLCVVVLVFAEIALMGFLLY